MRDNYSTDHEIACREALSGKGRGINTTGTRYTVRTTKFSLEAARGQEQ